MKILMVLTRWKGGVGGSVKEIKNELERKGHKVEVISREEDLGGKFNEGGLLKTFSKLRKEVDKREYDILYTQDWGCALPLLFFKSHYCCFHGHQTGKTKHLQNIVGRYLGRNLIVVGDSLKDKFPKSNLIYNGVDLIKFHDLKKERKYIGWVNKGAEDIDKQQFLNMAKKNNLKPIIAENYSIPFEKMNEDFYSKCKIFVSFPKKYAGFNLVWLEAKASGVPIIMGNDNGIGIKKVLETPIEYFSWNKNVNKLLEVWNERT